MSPHNIRPLSELLSRAEELIAHQPQTKLASGTSNEAEALSELLMSYSGGGIETTTESEVDLEKVAMAVNRLYLAAEIDTIHRIQEFEKRAATEGFAPEQIEEALSKVAAAKTRRNLAVLMGLGHKLGPADKNVAPKHPTKPLFASLLKTYDATKNLG